MILLHLFVDLMRGEVHAFMKQGAVESCCTAVSVFYKIITTESCIWSLRIKRPCVLRYGKFMYLGKHVCNILDLLFISFALHCSARSARRGVSFHYEVRLLLMAPVVSRGPWTVENAAVARELWFYIALPKACLWNATINVTILLRNNDL